MLFLLLIAALPAVAGLALGVGALPTRSREKYENNAAAWRKESCGSRLRKFCARTRPTVRVLSIRQTLEYAL